MLVKDALLLLFYLLVIQQKEKTKGFRLMQLFEMYIYVAELVASVPESCLL